MMVATLLALPPDVHAQAAAPLAGVVPEITVTATREPRQVDETTSTVTVHTAEEIEARFVRDIRDLVRNEPGVTVRRAPARFHAALPPPTGREGSAGFNIRGLEGNRVLIQVDGIRVPAAFQFGPAGFGRGVYTEVTTVRSVEILRGPASSLYGSDGLAGVVSFLTFDPADLLGEDRLHASAALAHASEDRSTTFSLRAAGRLGATVGATGERAPEVLAIVTERQAGELDNFGTNAAANATRTRPNPQDIDTGAVLARWVQPLSADARLRFTVERVRTTVVTDVLSARAVGPLIATSVLRLDARDTIERTRASADLIADRLDLPIAQSARLAVYWQESDARQLSFEDRHTAPDRIRDNRYGERVFGVNTQFALASTVFGLPQRLVYGIDHARAFIHNLRTGTVPPIGETFPTKAFADTDFNMTGAFAQSEVQIGERLFLIPALRYDRYRLSPRRDPLFPGVPAALGDSALTPRVAVRYLLAPGLNAYVNYAHGFLAPTPAQVNSGFTNLFGPIAYRSIGNPNLQPEHSATIEAGLRGSGPWLRWEVAAFDGRFTDFIEQRVVGGTGTMANPLLFQFINVAEVRIRGIEGRMRYLPARDWRLSAGFAYADGTDRSLDRPLNSVQPLRIVAGAEWLPTRELTLALFANHAGGKRRGDIDSTGIPGGQLQFAPPSWTVLDLTASLRWSRHLELGAGIFNLTNVKHWRWPDVQGQAQTSPVIDAFTQPRRSYALRVRATF
jgi:hemoglobin/transferrin/lactoferrin receptor protein